MGMIGRILQRFSAIAREEGLRAALSKCAHALRRANPPIDTFDAKFGSDTAREVGLWQLDVRSENAKLGVHYQTIAPSFFCDALELIPANPHALTFIDLGCGKGRMLILAVQHGFKRVIGVEFAPQLAAIARSNLERLSLSAEVEEMDAAQFTFPDEDLLIYMYNPFRTAVMERVVANLLQWRARFGRAAFIVYFNPLCASAFPSTFREVFTKDGLRIWAIG